jgi:hypothetical protein
VEALCAWIANRVDQRLEAKDHTLGVHRFSQLLRCDTKKSNAAKIPVISTFPEIGSALYRRVYL